MQMNDIDEDGSSIILSQLHQQEMNDIEKNVKDLNAEIMTQGIVTNNISIVTFDIEYLQKLSWVP